ncbi:RNA polymerase II-associated protein 1 [Hondaea fermentalgiana]|uniref:RNA polymerase II-associated protein 1 n=1 Tax=Hondaea fermentalgiana TaxID=2315210 RepID=A0A2R5GBM8_9STRA|nr:RNA polymerase II-associated protein 1 [Hondaea fermentalgiana]|eukprot:GBG28396.1 RNA polymerase II-associated protein 1 [Hondaea fermentalgiana]
MLHPRARSLEEDLELAAAGKLGNAGVKVLSAATDAKGGRLGVESAADGQDGAESASAAKPSPPATEGRRRVRFAVPDDEEEGSEDDPAARLAAHDRRDSIPGLLQEIQEREDMEATRRMFLPTSSSRDDNERNATGFPRAFRAVPSTKTQQAKTQQPRQQAEGGRKKVSLFKQMMLEKRGEEVPVETNGAAGASATARGNSAASSLTMPEEPPLGGGSFSIDRMSPSQIAEAQDEIRAQFDPEILERFMAKMNGSNAKKASENAPATQDTAAQQRAAREEREAKLKDLSWIRTEEQLDEAVNMLPVREREKLRWTGRIKGPAPTFGPANVDEEESEDLATRAGMQPGGAESLMSADFRTSIESARFDLEGNFIPPSTDEEAQLSGHHSALYHHGDEPERAGYTIIELTHLARSKAAAQKTLALSCIAKILRKRHVSLYGEGTPEEAERRSILVNGSHPLFSLPDQLGVVARMGLDSSNASVVTAAIEATEAFLVPRLHLDAIFETSAFSLGRFLPTHLPRAQGAQDVFARAFDNERLLPLQESGKKQDLSQTEDDDGDAVADTDALVQSPVDGMLRIGLIERIRYLFRVDSKLAAGVELGRDLVDRCLAMLTTIALHSDTGAAYVARAPGLLSWIAERLRQSLDSGEGSDAFLRLAYVLSASQRELARFLAHVAGKALQQRVLGGTWPLARHLLRVWRAMGALPTSVTDEQEIISYRASGAGAAASEGQVSDATAEIWAGRACAEAFMCAHEYLRSVRNAGRSVHDEGLADDLGRVNVKQTEPVNLVIADRGVDELFRAVHARLETILPSLIEDMSLVTADEVLLLLDLLVPLVRREDVRSQCYRFFLRSEVRSNLETLLLDAQLPEALESARYSSTPSLQQICIQRTFTMVWIRALQILSQVFGVVREDSSEVEGVHEGLEQRRALLAEMVPVVNPRLTGEEWAVSEIVAALFSPDLEISGSRSGAGALRTPIVACLGGERAVEASRVLICSGLGTGAIGEGLASLRLGHYREGLSPSAQKLDTVLGRRWQEARSAWVLLPLFVAFRAEGEAIVPQTIAAAQQLLNDGGVASEDMILTMTRIMSVVEAPSLMEEPNTLQLTSLVNDAFQDLREAAQVSGMDICQLLTEAAGSKATLLKLWEALIAAYNETLNGHPTATALLLIMLRTSGDRDLRLIVWSELADANLLRLLHPSQEFTALPDEELYQPEETWDEIIQCIARSLCSRILTKGNNAYLYKIAIRLLAQFFWLHSSSWNRRRILKMLAREGPLEEIATCVVDPVHQREPEALHPNAYPALRAVAREDELIRARIAISFPSVLAVDEGEGEVHVDHDAS